MKVWIAVQIRNDTTLYLDVPASPHPAFGTPLPRAGEGLGLRACRTAPVQSTFRRGGSLGRILRLRYSNMRMIHVVHLLPLNRRGHRGRRRRPNRRHWHSRKSLKSAPNRLLVEIDESQLDWLHSRRPFQTVVKKQGSQHYNKSKKHEVFRSIEALDTIPQLRIVGVTMLVSFDCWLLRIRAVVSSTCLQWTVAVARAGEL